VEGLVVGASAQMCKELDMVQRFQPLWEWSREAHSVLERACILPRVRSVVLSMAAAHAYSLPLRLPKPQTHSSL
jgi:hypothetical protein